MKNTRFIVLAALFGALAVLFGAFGAHALKAPLSTEQLTSYQTGVSYHFYHTFALLITGIWYAQSENSRLRWAAIAFAVGIVLFSGSIYLLACKDLLHLGGFTKILGPVTPLGGLFFIAGWVFLGLAAGARPRPRPRPRV